MRDIFQLPVKDRIEESSSKLSMQSEQSQKEIYIFHGFILTYSSFTGIFTGKIENLQNL